MSALLVRLPLTSKVKSWSTLPSKRVNVDSPACGSVVAELTLPTWAGAEGWSTQIRCQIALKRDVWRGKPFFSVGRRLVFFGNLHGVPPTVGTCFFLKWARFDNNRLGELNPRGESWDLKSLVKKLEIQFHTLSQTPLFWDRPSHRWFLGSTPFYSGIFAKNNLKPLRRPWCLPRKTQGAIQTHQTSGKHFPCQNLIANPQIPTVNESPPKMSASKILHKTTCLAALTRSAKCRPHFHKQKSIGKIGFTEDFWSKGVWMIP